jgi:hypothetical protein
MALKSDLVARSKLEGPEEQKAAIFTRLGDLDQYEMLDEEVLVGVYVPSNVLASGKNAQGEDFSLISIDNASDEFRFQGKIGCVIKLGPTAFKYMNNGQLYDGIKVKKGDWVVFRASDSAEIFLRGMEHEGRGDYVCCRRLNALNIKMRIKDPRAVR